jgi:hypothetical protein
MQPLSCRQSNMRISRLGGCCLGTSEGMRPPMRLNRKPLLTWGWSWALLSSIHLTSLAWPNMNGTRSALASFGMCRERLIAALHALQVERSTWSARRWSMLFHQGAAGERGA